ncbi:hypothetical protein EVJ58_g6892, partial [Rhodofomes roseus]
RDASISGSPPARSPRDRGVSADPISVLSSISSSLPAPSASALLSAPAPRARVHVVVDLLVLVVLVQHRVVVVRLVRLGLARAAHRGARECYAAELAGLAAGAAGKE